MSFSAGLQTAIISLFLIIYISGCILFGILFRGKTYVFKSDDLEELGPRDLLKSWMGILYYFLVMFIIASVLSTILVMAWANSHNVDLKNLIANEEEPYITLYNEMSAELNPLLEIIVYSVSIIGVVLFAFKYLKEDIKKFKPTTLMWAGIGVGFVYGANLISQLILIICGINEQSANQQAIEQMTSSGTKSLILMCITTILMAPILEELVFRKFFFNIFKKSPKLGLIFSSLIFGLIHVISAMTIELRGIIDGSGSFLLLLKATIQIIPYSLMGAALGMTYLCSRKNICASILTHMSINLISMVMVIITSLK